MGTELRFPEGFFWGSATSAYQVEGEIRNNDWAEAARQGKIPPAGYACGHYNRYQEDFDIAKSLGQNAHRFSVEWARIEPEEGRFNEAEIEHYQKVLAALRERGIEPFVTLWHFTLPIWFARMGGFENKKAPFYFSRYCEFVVKKLGQGSEGPKFWITINEPMVYASNGFLQGKWPPFRKNLPIFLRVVKNLITSHNLGYRKIKALNSAFQVGIAKNNIYFGSNWNPFNHLLSSFLAWFWNRRFLNKISKFQDFIGLNYYFRKKFGEKAVHPKSDMNWDLYPPGIYNLLIELRRYHKPVYVTENGLADAKDTRRAKFIKDHLLWVKRAIDDKIDPVRNSRASPVIRSNPALLEKELGADMPLAGRTSNGVDVRGYFYWSLLDNYEWADGFKPRFGLVEVNYKTMKRKVRPSAYDYAKICKANSLSPNVKIQMSNQAQISKSKTF